MKKVISILLLTLMLFCVIPALAEGVAAVTDVPTDFFSWATIGTFAGAVAMTVFITQALKMPADKAFGGHVPTRLIVYIIALALLLMSQAFLNGGLTFETICLTVINAFLVMLAAMSTYTMLIEQTEIRKMANSVFIVNGKNEEQETDPPSEEAVTTE